jgi:formylmethanofuran dehydrogenase subunit E
MISLKEAVKFHGHLGPYLILGILSGDFALKKLGAKKYFGLEVKVWGANKKPKSCLIDGLQLSTGATYGKGNIRKLNGALIRMEFCNKENNKRIVLELKDKVRNKLDNLRGHTDSEEVARKLYKERRNGAFRFRYL